jgi:hypothetical protein
MQDQQIPNFEVKEGPLSLRTQQLIEYLGDLWQRPYKPSTEMLKRITEFLSQLPDTCQSLGLTKIAEYLVGNMGLHYLDMMALFQQKAEDEGIDKEERIETLRGVMPLLFSEMMAASKQIVIRTLDDLVTLSNITSGLHALSQAKTAEEAQSWMYELPVIYLRQLKQERLLTNFQFQFTVTESTTAMRFSGSTSWESYLPCPLYGRLLISWCKIELF